MRLWLISHNYAPEPTGIPYYNTGLAEWLVRRGWSVEVFTGVPHYPWWEVPEAYRGRDFHHGRGDETINGVVVRRVRHFVPAPPVSGLGRMRLDASYLGRWMGRSLSLRGRPDIILGVAPPFLVGGLLLWLRHRLRVPVVYHVQDLQVDAALELGLLPRGVGGVLRSMERLLLERVDQVTACGRGMLPRLASKGRLRRPPRHWPNWADCTSMRPWTGPNPERGPLDGGRPECVVGLYSGNLGRKQDLGTLIEASRRLSHLPRWRTVIAGAGAGGQEIARAAIGVGNLEIQELRPADRLRPFLAAADIHVITQRREAADLVLPSKLLNSMAVGRPVVATADPGTELRAVIDESGCGVAVPPGDPIALAAVLERLAGDAASRTAMGLAGRTWVERHFDRDAVLARIERDLIALVRLG